MVRLVLDARGESDLHQDGFKIAVRTAARTTAAAPITATLTPESLSAMAYG